MALCAGGAAEDAVLVDVLLALVSALHQRQRLHGLKHAGTQKGRRGSWVLLASSFLSLHVCLVGWMVGWFLLLLLLLPLRASVCKCV